MNKAAINIHVQVFVWMYIFSFFGLKFKELDCWIRYPAVPAIFVEDTCLTFHCFNLMTAQYLVLGYTHTCLRMCLVTQSYLSLYDPMDCSSSSSCVHGILHARILKWVAMLFFRGSSQSTGQTQVSCIAGRFFLPSEPSGKPTIVSGRLKAKINGVLQKL